MDITELTGAAETSSRIIGLHLQRGKFSCRFGAMFVTLWFIGKLQLSAAVCIQHDSFSCVSCLLHVSPSIVLYFNTNTKTLPPVLSLRGLGFDPRPVQLKFVVGKVSPVQVFIRALLLPPMLHTHSVTFQ
jgi:hypothetical protein